MARLSTALLCTIYTSTKRLEMVSVYIFHVENLSIRGAGLNSWSSWSQVNMVLFHKCICNWRLSVTNIWYFMYFHGDVFLTELKKLFLRYSWKCFCFILKVIFSLSLSPNRGAFKERCFTGASRWRDIYWKSNYVFICKRLMRIWLRERSISLQFHQELPYQSQCISSL